jgi:UrcA family protein
MTRTLTLAALSAALVAGTAAQAAPNRIDNSRLVPIADINLASLEGRKKLDMRIKRAARSVCGVGEYRDLKSASTARSCYQKAMTDVQDQVVAALRANGQAVALLDVQ